MPARFPDFARALETEFARRQSRGEQHGVRWLARTLRTVSATTVSAWRLGKRIPSDHQLDLLVRALRSDPDEIEILRRALLAARDRATPAPASALGDALTIGVIDYSAIANSANGYGFLNTLLRRFLMYADLPINESRDTKLVDARKSLLEGGVDIVAGIMATVDRGKELTFFPTPISLPINAVTYASHASEHGDRIRSALATSSPLPLQLADGPLSSIHPIFEPSEVGGLYCRLNLGFTPALPDSYTEVANYDPAAYLETLRRFHPERTSTPVIVADELMCLQILKRAPSEAALVFPLLDSQLPRYSVGYAVASRCTSLIRYLRENLPTYFLADLQYVVKSYEKLGRTLQDLLSDLHTRGIRLDSASDWPPHVLGLTTERRLPVMDLGWSLVTDECKRHRSAASESKKEPDPSLRSSLSKIVDQLAEIVSQLPTTSL